MVAVRLAQDHAVVGVRPVVIASLALLPFWFPSSLAMLFGNLDMIFPALFGAILLIAVARPTRGRVIVAGIALALATVTKLHPAVLGIWLLARAVPRVALWTVGGRGPGSAADEGWRPAIHARRRRGRCDRARHPRMQSPRRRSAAVARLRDRGSSEPPSTCWIRATWAPRPRLRWRWAIASRAPAAPAAVIGVAIIVTVLAALFVEDPLESLLWATVASLVVLPVTWYHHFAVLIPFGVVCVSRVSGRADAERRRLVIAMFAGTMVLAALVFATVATWVLVPVAVVLVRLSRGTGVSAAQAVRVSVAGTG